MFEMDFLVIGTIVLALAVATWKFWRDKPDSVREVAANIIDAAEMADVLVSAAEQLWTSGRLPKDERFNYVMGQLRDEFPTMDVDQLEATVESAVYWLKLAVRSK
jgi:hypothetical protein